MWKKDELGAPVPGAPQTDEPSIQRPTARPAASPSERATIGPSITIKGEVSGDEDLLIQGRIEGSVDLKLQSVTVGREGRVKAGISGRVVTVEGEVDGDLRAQEQVILRSSARVQGDITAPRVVLEDGANFRGLVDMGEVPSSGRRNESGASSGRDAKKPTGSSSSVAAGGSSSAPDAPAKPSEAGRSQGTGEGASSSKAPSHGEKEPSSSAD